MENENLIDQSVNSISELIEEVFDKMMESADLLVEVSTVIAGIGCIIYLATILLPMIEKAERIQIYPLLKPIFVAIVIANFPTLTSAGSEISSSLGQAIGKLVTVSDTNSYFTLFLEKVDEMTDRQDPDTPPPAPAPRSNVKRTYNYYGKELPVDDYGYVQLPDRTEKVGEDLTKRQGSSTEGDESGFWSWILWKFVYGVLIPALAWLAMFLGQIFYIGLLLFSKFYLVILSIVGPLSFALSQFKMFAGSVSQWLARFISVGLWPGIAGLVRGITDQIVMAIAENLQPTVSAVVVAILLLIFSATLYLHVPTLADFIIRSGGVGNTTGSAKKMAKKVTKVL